MAEGFQQHLIKVRVYEGQEQDWQDFLMQPHRFRLVPTGYRDGCDGELILERLEKEYGG